MDVEKEKGTVMNWKKLAKMTVVAVIVLLGCIALQVVLSVLMILCPTIGIIVTVGVILALLIWFLYKML